MNNTMCAGVFLSLVYRRHLAWDYTSEVLCILLPTALLTWLGSTRRTVRTVWALPVLAAYPTVLLLQFLLKQVLGCH